MKKKKRLLGIFFIISALILMELPMTGVRAATSSNSNFKIDGVTLTKYSGTSENVIVPDTVEVISEGAFSENTTLKTLKLPKSIKKIEPYSFWGCNSLETVVLEEGIPAIDDYAFANCKGLKKINIPKTVTDIGICAFQDCVRLETISIPVEVRRIHESSFNGCYKLIIQAQEGSYASRYAAEFYERQKEMPEYEDVSDYQPENGNGNTSNSVPDNNSSGGNTGNNADNGITSSNNGTVVIVSPEQDNGNVLGTSRVVGNQAVVFMDSYSSKVYSGNDLPVTVTPSELENATPEPGQSSEVIYQNVNIYPKYRIVNGRVIADQAYYRNAGLNNVNIPSGVEEIGEFSYARSDLESLTVPEGAKYIDYGAFYHCDDLQIVRLPSTIENIEPKAFANSGYVNSFLTGNSGSGDYLISGNSLIAYRGSSPKVTIPDGVRVIAGEAFKGHTEIENVVFPDSLLVVGEASFEGCSNLKEISLGNTVSAIKDRAFLGCGLTEVSAPASLKSLGVSAFGEDVSVNFFGNVARTHENSAERLSNESYRGTVAGNGSAGVSVVGMENVTARLEGASTQYTLTIADNSNTADFLNTYRNTAGKEYPADCPIYEMSLTDNSGIPITRLGHQLLYVTIPVDESFAGWKAEVVTLDRNGQLESINSERVTMNGQDCVRIITNHLSHFGIVRTEEALGDNDVIAMSTEFRSGAALPDSEVGGFINDVKVVLAVLLFLAGFVLIFHSTKNFVK